MAVWSSCISKPWLCSSKNLLSHYLLETERLHNRSTVHRHGFFSQAGSSLPPSITNGIRIKSRSFEDSGREGCGTRKNAVIRSMRASKQTPPMESRSPMLESGMLMEIPGFVSSLDRPPDNTLPAEFEGVPLLYRPYVEYIWGALTNSNLGLRDEPLPADLQYRWGSAGSKSAEMHSWLLSASRLRRVRMTYFLSKTCEAFNCVFYPEHKYNLPLLGIDLLSFSNGKILWVVDFQPLSKSPEYMAKHTEVLSEAFARVSMLCGDMSNRFFDPTEFISDKRIFFKSKLGHLEPAIQVPDGKLYVAYTQYIQLYLRQLAEADPLTDDLAVAAVARSERAYDDYFAQRDPAIGLFNTFFGKEWSQRYTHDFLFTGTSFDHSL